MKPTSLLNSKSITANSFWLNSIIVVFISFISINSYASHPSNSSIPLLIDSEKLQSYLKEPKQNTVLIDLRTNKEYLKGHIPSSINIPYDSFNRSIQKVKGFLLAPLDFQELMEKNGIQQTDHLIFYSDKTVLESTRTYWAFDFYGHKKLTVLDGGITAWAKNGGTIEKGVNKLKPSQYEVTIHPEKFASKFKTAMATKQSNSYLIDARPPAEYNGKESKTDQFGHIPTAVNLPWPTLVEPSEKPPSKDSFFRYLPLNELEKKFENVPEDKKLILYCNGGKESSVIYFGLKLLGRDAALYDGSWFEWSSDKSLPIESPTKGDQVESRE